MWNNILFNQPKGKIFPAAWRLDVSEVIATYEEKDEGAFTSVYEHFVQIGR